MKLLDILKERTIELNNLTATLNDEKMLIDIQSSIDLLSKAVNSRSPILIFGNGGSASDAQHIVGELVGKFLKKRKPVNAICLNSNTSVLTAWANDVAYDDIFSRQIEAFHGQDTLCWGISTSGNSRNVVRGIEKANSLGMDTISLSGSGGGKLLELCDVCINVRSNSTPRIQEMHIIIYHLICEVLEIGLA
ncbi:SIS domain-containing protein [Paracoccaceae bacterium]|nr:SIS domain-containing protein [Paracoccaceae bacterium]